MIYEPWSVILNTNLHSPEVTWQEEDDGDQTGDEGSPTEPQSR